MNNCINIVTLTLNYNDELVSTIDSVKLWSGENPEILFNQIVVVPFFKNVPKLENTLNYKINFVIDKKEGIYEAFNLALSNAIEPGYIIFVAAGDTIESKVKINQYYFNYDLISFGVNLQGEKNTKKFAKYSTKYLKGIPHPSLLTRVESLKRINGFSTTFGTASDYHATCKLLKNGNSLIINEEILTNFRLGGASSSMGSIRGYYKSLVNLNFNPFVILFFCIFKFCSIVKYKIFK